MARPTLSPEQRAAADARQRAKVMGGLAECIARDGYAATTIGRIAEAAKVSNSTVYSQFADKESVLVALYDDLIDRLIEVIRQADADAAQAGLVGRERIAAGVRSYVSVMVGGGPLTRAMLIEAPAVGPRVFEARQRGRRRYVELLERMAQGLAGEEGWSARPPRVLLVAAIGGVNELLLGAFDESSPRSAAEITGDATALLCALLRAEGE